MKRLLKQSTVYFLANFLLKAISFVLLPFYTHIMDPKTLGVVFICVFLTEGLILLFGFSLKASILLYCVKLRRVINKRRFLSSVVMVTFITSLAMLTILGFVYKPVTHYLDLTLSVYWLVVLSAALGLFFPLILSYYQALEKVKKVFTLSFFSGLINIVCILTAVLSFDDAVFGYMFGYFIYIIVSFGIFISFYLKERSFPSWRFTRFALLYAKNYYFTDLSAWIVSFSDRLMLYKMLGSSASGMYTAAYKLSQSCDVIYHSINKASSPILFSELKDNKVNKRYRLSCLYNSLISFSILVAGGLIFISPWLLKLLDDEYKNLNWIFVLIVLSCLLNAIKMIVDKPMSYYENLVKYKSITWFFAAIVNLFLNFLLIPILGMEGAAIATFISFLITLVPVYLISKKAVDFEVDYAWNFALFICWGVVSLVGVYYVYIALFLGGGVFFL
ncbi:oligosaccharide flippase family protein, partial [Pseudoalteromonas phenolica]|uniref:oligosaccharide flippase family protein n=1 Tax=Pseudoalteromonas phenolica TaxID=161398 RepID=UPI00110A8DBC